MKVLLREARRVSAGVAPAGAVVDLPSHEALDLLDRGLADSVSCRATVTPIPTALEAMQERGTTLPEAAPASRQGRRKKSATRTGAAG